MKIEIIKAHKLLVVGQVLEIDRGYSLDLIKKGIAKNLEIQEEIQEEIQNDFILELQEVIYEGRSLIADLKAIIDSFTPITGIIESSVEVDELERKEIMVEVPEVVEPTLKKIK